MWKEEHESFCGDIGTSITPNDMFTWQTCAQALLVRSIVDLRPSQFSVYCHITHLH
jgi:hypothetical protein